MIFGGASNPAGAQGANRAGLVIRYGDGTVSTYCVQFDEAEISGFDLLLRSGVDVVYSSSGIGAMICKIGDEGCDNPGNCLCQCRGTSCLYWSYWHQIDGAWQYSSIGASLSRVKPGAVEGWTWGVGTIDAAPQPPLISLDEICLGLRPSPATATSTWTLAATPTPVPTDTPRPTQTAALTRTPLSAITLAAKTAVVITATPGPTSSLPPSATSTASPSSKPTATNPPNPSPTQTAAAALPAHSPAAEYWGFGVLLVLLIGVGWLALRRKAA